MNQNNLNVLLQFLPPLGILVMLLSISCHSHFSGSDVQWTIESPAVVAESTSQVSNEPMGTAGSIRHGGSVVVAKAMPDREYPAYLWAKHVGTLVAYEAFLRRYAHGTYAEEVRRRVQAEFVPKNQRWQESWRWYSRFEEIRGAICRSEGVILLGKEGERRLPPFCHDDVLAALRTLLAGDRVGVTMNAIFPARFAQPSDPTTFPHIAHETSVQFYSTHLWNTHLAAVLFEGDRMLKSLSAGYDLFHGTQVRSSIDGFSSILEMARARAPMTWNGDPQYGRVWIEVTDVKLNTTEDKSAALFSDVRLVIRSESKHEPPRVFAKHIQDHYAEYAQEFVIFGEVERAARVVAIAQWLVDTFPDVARKLVQEGYEELSINVPRVIEAKYDRLHRNQSGEIGLIGGIVYNAANRYENAPEATVGDTRLMDLEQAVLRTRPHQAQDAWPVRFGTGPNDTYIAWTLSLRESGGSGTN